MMNVDHFSRNTQESHGFSTSFCLPPGYLPGEDARFFVWRSARWANWMFDVAKYDKERNNFTFGRGGNQGARGENKGKALGVGRFVCRFFVARLWPLGVSKNCIFRMIVFSNGRKVESLKGGLSRLLEKKGGGQPEPLNSFVWLLRWYLKILRMRGEQTKTLSGSRNNHDQIGELVI